MKRHSLLPGLLLASGALALGSSQAPADIASDSGRAQAVTYRVGTGRSFVRADRPVAAKLATAASRVRAGALPRSGRVADEFAPRPRKVFGSDDRFAVSDPTAYPWSAVCRVQSTFPDGTAIQGSAILVGGRFALTAGHMVYDDADGGFAETVEVVPAYDQGDAPFGRFVAEEITSFTGFTRDRDHDWDFALLELDGEPGIETGWMGFASYDDAYLTDLTVNTAGYPGDRDAGELMYGASGAVSQALPGQLRMRGTMDAGHGQSGSGVWEILDGDRYVVGVVSNETSSWNQAARVTGEVFDALSEWIDLADAPDFAVTSVVSPLPAEFELPHSGEVTVRVENDGRSGGDVAVAVVARTLRGARVQIGSRVVAVAAGVVTDAVIPVSFPEGLAGGVRVLEAQVNGDRSVLEPNYGDNRRDGRRVVVLPPFTEIDTGVPSRSALGPGGVARKTFEVPEGLRALRLKFAGPTGGTVTVTRPDGTRLRLRPGRTVRVAPLAGTWDADVRAPVRIRRALPFTFQAIPRY